jgi:PIN domain nuclease of toxin-antitoxin system
LAFLLDTNVLLWSVVEPDRLSSAALKILGTDSERLYFSAASSLEIAIKYSIGKLSLPSPPTDFIPKLMGEMNLIPLDVSNSHALAVGKLPLHHRDPFDRLLVAQAQAEGLIVLTIDKSFAKYEVEAILCRA